MRFIDANVFLYAAIKPNGTVSKKILERKEKAKRILLRIENGEEVATTVVHLSEVVNILEAKTNLTTALMFIESLLLAENVRVLPVSHEDYLKALLIAKEKNISVNDALAYLKMKKKEIYTFDDHFKNLDVAILTSSPPEGRGFPKGEPALAPSHDGVIAFGWCHRVGSEQPSKR